MQKIWIVNQKCIECGGDYEARHYRFALEIDASRGLCQSCMTERARKKIIVGCQICHQQFTTTYIGYRDLKLFVSDICPDCSKVQEENEAAVRFSAIASQRKRWRESSGIPENFMNKEFGDFSAYSGNLKTMAKKCQEFADNFPIPYRDYQKKAEKDYPSLVLVAEAGRGKTHLACAVGHRILNRWNGKNTETASNPIVFISEPELYLRIKETYSFSAEEKKVRESESDIINRLVSRDLLILDDVGKDQKADMSFVRRVLFMVINGRYNAQRPVILTTNLSDAGLEDYLGKTNDENPIFSRLYQMTGGKFLKINADDYRKK